MHTATAPALTADPITETLATIDSLLQRSEALAAEVARLRQDLAELGQEQKLREAVLALGIEGRNAEERHARMTLELASDGDVRRLKAAERETRLRLAEAEARLWVTQKRIAVCLALLKLAADADAGGDEGEV